MAKLLITGASGQLGRQAIEVLAQKTDKSDIIAMVRSDAQAAVLARTGITTRYGDYNDPASLAQAFAGIDRLLLVSGSDMENRVTHHKVAIAEAKTAGVKHIVYTSLLKAGDSPMPLAADHKATEEFIAESGLSATILRNGWYSENMLMGLEQDLSMRQHFGAAADGKFSFASRGDLAEAAAITLLGGYDGQTLELAGDEALTMAEYTAILSDIAGKPVAYVDMPQQAYQDALVGAGLPEVFASFLAATDAFAAQGALHDDSATLSRILGRPTTQMATVLKTALATQS
ncbi:SDR family oxidoreductase [Shimia sp. NS0008-38b]|uniref:SDR family oxidoreductase n=1 Tax=Shimia sp. NS0008-38b TaxID=3127653 RepID=UPI003102D992